MDILAIVLGAILGALFSFLLPEYRKKIKSRLQLRRIKERRSLVESGKVYEWLIEYYNRRSNLNDLFDCKIGNFEIKIPFLTKTTKQFLNSIDVFDLGQAEECFKQNPNIGRESVAISRDREQLKERIRLRKQFLDDSDNKEVVHIRKACPTMPNPLFFWSAVKTKPKPSGWFWRAKRGRNDFRRR